MLTSAIFSVSSTRPPLSDPGPKAGMQSGHGTGDRLASHDTYQPQGEQGQGHVSRKSLQVDVGGSRPGRSPSVSPDRGSVPTSPYSVPQIAPMPSSKLCPVCKTTDLMGVGDSFNTCTQCRCKVCNQCGFNPNPHLTEVRNTIPFNRKMDLCSEYLHRHFCSINQENILSGYTTQSAPAIVNPQGKDNKEAFMQSTAKAPLGRLITYVMKDY